MLLWKAHGSSTAVCRLDQGGYYFSLPGWTRSIEHLALSSSAPSMTDEISVNPMNDSDSDEGQGAVAKAAAKIEKKKAKVRVCVRLRLVCAECT